MAPDQQDSRNTRAVPQGRSRPRRRKWRWIAAAVGLLVVAAFVANAGYYLGSASSGEFCAGCHIIRPSVELWQISTHRNVPCTACHGSALTLDLDTQRTHWSRLYRQITGNLPRDLALQDRHVDGLNERCIACHRQAGAAWLSGGHSVTYADVFLNPEQNRTVLLHDDCLRCHGMYFDQGGVASLVQPVDTTGPWSFVDPAVARRPAIPCIACHRVHLPGTPATRPDYAQPRRIAHTRDAAVESLAFYDRREKLSIPVKNLPLPDLRHEGRRVRRSPDPRQALCYQCHAPETSYHVGSGDDRTPLGVHEGISCLACHTEHSLDAKASCAGCHPKMSNCGLDVEKMDTTFRSPDSAHNIHWVRCEDCHVAGVPPRRR